jgi:hypothetical protein
MSIANDARRGRFSGAPGSDIPVSRLSMLTCGFGFGFSFSFGFGFGFGRAGKWHALAALVDAHLWFWGGSFGVSLGGSWGHDLGVSVPSSELVWVRLGVGLGFS